MPFMDALKDFLTIGPLHEPMHQRTVLATPFDVYPDLPTQIANIRRSHSGSLRAVTVREALSVPAIFGAVNLVANLTGSMSMQTYRNEVEMPPADRPRIVVRPDPFKIPRRFYGPTAYNMASRGEAWWWVAARDSDGLALSVLNVAPFEVQVEENPDDARYPWITWRNRTTKRPLPPGFQGMAFDDMRQIVYQEDPDFPLRGVGPLQMCGAAISVAVESQSWAANFFNSGNSAIWVKTNLDLSGDDRGDDNEDIPDGLSEAQRFKDQWMEMDPNQPRVTGDTVEDIKDISINPQGAAMLEARQYQNSEVATMFNMDAAILNAAVSGSSITYQNVGTKFEDLLRSCLRPNYLEPIEQTMSDLLPRSIVARCNTDSITLADIKTRYDVYGIGIDKLIITPEEARSFEGLAPGDVENAAVPFSPPQAIPTAAEVQVQTRSLPVEVRCENIVTKRRSGVTRVLPCGKLLSTDGTNPGWCPRCRQSTAVVA